MLKHHLIRRTAATGLLIAAAASPSTAQATFMSAGSDPGPIAAPVSTSHVSRAQSSSFQWADAGIGAAGATLLLGAAAAGTGLTRRRRLQRPVMG